jgi:hypothetical protein
MNRLESNDGTILGEFCGTRNLTASQVGRYNLADHLIGRRGNRYIWASGLTEGQKRARELQAQVISGGRSRAEWVILGVLLAGAITNGVILSREFSERVAATREIMDEISKIQQAQKAFTDARISTINKPQ